MSGKFMKIRRIIIPTITMVIIASQLMGCSAASQSELLQMINNGDQIEIEVATPAFAEDEQGEESTIDWVELGSLETNDALRSEWNNILNISGTTGNRNGMLFVGVDGKNTQNNTLAVAIKNNLFQSSLNDDIKSEKLVQGVLKQYVDIEDSEVSKAIAMGINGYFGLLADNTPNYSNPDSTLERNEFMAMVFKADTPVQEDIELDTNFASNVGENKLNIYAQGTAQNSYLDIESKSLNNMTYNGTITRAEAVYLLVNRYFNSDYNALANYDSVKFIDAKDGGNIAEEQKFIENATEKDCWKSYELAYVLQNPDTGVPTSLYKALVVGYQKGLIGSETRWDEAITKSEAIDMLMEALKQNPAISMYSANQGTVEGNEAETPVLTIDESGTDDDDARTEDEIILEAIETEDSIEEKDYEIEGIEPTQMYALQASNIRKGPSTDYEKVGSLVYGEEVTVIGKVTNTEGKEWYVLKGETEEGEEDRMVSSTLLSMEKPQSQAVNSSNNNTSTNTSAPSNNESYIDANTVDWGALGLPAQPDSNIEWGAGTHDTSSASRYADRGSAE